MSDTLLFVIIGAALALTVVIRIIAGTDTAVGKVFRWFWNISFRITSHFPFMGWLAYLIVAKTPKEKAMKARALGSSTAAQDLYGEQAKNIAAKQQAEADREEKIRSEMAQRGYETVSINSDGTTAVGKDKYGNTHNVTIDWI